MGKLAKEFLQKHLVKAANGVRPSVYTCNRKKKSDVNKIWELFLHHEQIMLSLQLCIVILTSENIPSPNHSTLRIPTGAHLVFHGTTIPGHQLNPLTLPHTSTPVRNPLPSCSKNTKTKADYSHFLINRHFIWFNCQCLCMHLLLGFCVFLWNKAAVTLPGRPVYVVLWLVCVYWALKSLPTGSQPHLGKKRSQRSKR